MLNPYFSRNSIALPDDHPALAIHSYLLQFGNLREINNVCTQETLCLAKENCII